jgi:hypothetical protein
MSRFLYANASGLSLAAFASYFDVYSHSHIFVGIDPWWNPAHLMLYAGFAVVAYGVFSDNPGGSAGKLSMVGVAAVVAAAVFNEVWHRVLLYGNPLPEPFPVEPPHALLAVGFVVLGASALVHPLGDPAALAHVKGRVAVAFTSGSLWLIVAGSAFYVGGAYQTNAANLFAVGAACFGASLFIAYPTLVAGRFGYSTLSYLWFLLVYYAFFVSPADGLPLGVVLVVVTDLALAKGRVSGVDARLFVLPLVAFLYGIVYYPILPAGMTLAVNPGLGASAAGVAAEYLSEREFVRRRSPRIDSARRSGASD